MYCWASSNIECTHVFLLSVQLPDTQHVPKIMMTVLGMVPCMNHISMCNGYCEFGYSGLDPSSQSGLLLRYGLELGLSTGLAYFSASRQCFS